MLASVEGFAFMGQVTAETADTSRTSSVPTLRMIPGPEYRAGGLHRLLAGAHWRDLWATEFDAEVLDLDTFAGGLTPTRKGGSLQTKNLRFIGNDGREYKFRSLNKDGKRALPRELQESIIADIYQDQISIGNPMAAVVAAPLMSALGILNAEPRIAVMPRSNRLGAFNEEFAGVLGTIEEHPKAGKENEPGFAGADKIVDGFEIFEILKNDHNQRIDEAEYLKARLFDLLVGDRDRHADQYRWAGYARDGKRFWRPIPRDRDFAFGRYDGVFPTVAGWYAHSVAGFGDTYPSILELTWIGRHLDRRFLGMTGKPVWDSLAAFVQHTLSDSVFQSALNAMPPEMYHTSGEEMFRMLRARREKLKEASDEFYSLVSDVVDVYGSDNSERFDITELNADQVEATVFAKESGELLASRIFSDDETGEIRIHLLGGDDSVTVRGEGKAGILVRILGGDGAVSGQSRSGRTLVYESAFPETIAVEPSLEDRYTVWRLLPWLNFNSDDGLILGIAPDVTKYAFRADPYAHAAEMVAAFAPQTSRYDFRLHAESYEIARNVRAEISVRVSNIGFADFYGLGNETAYDKSLAENDFYRSNYRTILVQPSLNVRTSEQTEVYFTGSYEYTEATLTQGRFLDLTRPYGLGFRSLLAMGGGVVFDSRDAAVAPSRGVRLSTGALWYPRIFRSNSSFTKAHIDVRGFLPLGNAVIAAHAGAEKVFDSYPLAAFPFYHAATIGGMNTVRGFARERFAGDAALFGQLEARIPVARVNLFVPGALGLLFFGDAGRVFLEGENSRRWHSGFGGGVWLNAINKLVVNLSVAGSTEGVKVYVTSGFGF